MNTRRKKLQTTIHVPLDKLLSSQSWWFLRWIELALMAYNQPDPDRSEVLAQRRLVSSTRKRQSIDVKKRCLRVMNLLTVTGIPECGIHKSKKTLSSNTRKLRCIYFACKNKEAKRKKDLTLHLFWYKGYLLSKFLQLLFLVKTMVMII